MSVQDLIAELQSPEPSTRCQAAEQLAHMGEEAQPAATALLAAVGDEDDVMREWAASALEALGTPPVDQRDAIAAKLNDADPDVAYWAATLLGRLEGEGAPATAGLIAALAEDRPGQVRQRAAWALGKIGPAAAAALPSLKALAGGEDPRLVRLAEHAVEAIEG